MTTISEENSLLSHEEWEVYSHLSLAYNAFIQLETIFPSDKADFERGINELKNLLMSRPVARELQQKGVGGYKGNAGEVQS